MGATLRLTRINLYDRFPGPVNPNRGVPVDGWGKNDGTIPAFQLGEKRMAYTDNSHAPGYFTMMYGALAGVSKTNYCVSHDYSHGKCWVGHCCLTTDVSHAADPTYLIGNPDGTAQPWHVMHRCTSVSDTGFRTTDMSSAGGAAIPCGTMDPYDHGWFWVGGVCPCKDVTIMGGSAGDGADMTTYGDVETGGVYLCATALATWMIREISNAWAISIGGAANAFTFAMPPIGWASMCDE